MQYRALAAVAPALLLAAACGSEEGGGQTVDRDGAVFGRDAGASDGGAGGAGGGAGGAGGGGEATEVLRLSYIKEVTPAGATPERDLMVYDFDRDEVSNLTPGDGGAVDCTTQCKLTADMRMVGWLAPGAGAGYDLWVAPVDVQRMRVREADKRKVSDQVHVFDFADDLVVFSRTAAGGEPNTMDIVAEPASGPDPGCGGGDVPPVRCQQTVGTIGSNGGFRVTPYGSLIIVLKTTLSSMTVQFVNVETGANQDIYEFGEAGSTGSQFDGRQPVALSPDLTYLAVFTRDEFIWRIHALEARPGPPDPVNLELFEMPTHPDGDCRRPMPHAAGEAFFNQVRFNPRFSHEGDKIYFLAVGDCTEGANRDDFDVLRIDRDLDPDSLVNVTNNPHANHWSNHQIADFDITADGRKLAFAAPRPTDANSSSVWLLDPETGEYDCSRGDPQRAIDGKTHCEFLFEDVAGAKVIHRGVTFHTVTVRR